MWKYAVVTVVIALLLFFAVDMSVVFDTHMPMPHGAH